MIGDLLPQTVVTVEAYGDEGADAPLYPEEEALIRRAVLKRRREFTAVRSCARRAMEKLGVPPRAVLPGERGAPRWPEGLTGSMTHCQGYCAAALVRAGDLASVGIDAEVHGPLPEGVLPSVALPQEAERIAALAGEVPSVHWDRLLFSAKEAVYKAWFPLTGKWLDFEEADIDLFPDDGETARGGFRAALLVPGPLVGGRRVSHFSGRWAAGDGLIATAIAVPHGAAPPVT
ncbi:4'-phosphopantetheinyl transferase [Streptomyces pilosus]